MDIKISPGLINCPEVGYCAPALSYIDFRLVRVGLGWFGLCSFVWADMVWVGLG